MPIINQVSILYCNPNIEKNAKQDKIFNKFNGNEK